MDSDKKYIPDAVYGVCSKFSEDCKECSNLVYSDFLGGTVHDTLRGKVFCPFGIGDSMNQNIFADQLSINKQYKNTKWGRAPQMDPSSLTRIGLEWRTA